MTDYVVLLPGNEDTWAATPEDERQRVYARHAEFAAALAERGHKVTGGAELTHSREAHVVRRTGGETAVTAGPYAETTEQLTGFYLVQSDDLDDLLEVCAILADGDGPVEVRACVEGPANPA
jgi:hypothetical protein